MAEKASKKKSGGFQSLGLSSNIIGGILKMGYKVPTPIQRKTLPLALAGKDVVAMARTGPSLSPFWRIVLVFQLFSTEKFWFVFVLPGSGKTAAFLIPILERLKEHSPKFGCRAVVLSPTRELAMQTAKFLKDMAKFTTLRFTVLVGGDSMELQVGNTMIAVSHGFRGQAL
jgi:ATP-dependent RNA helicase DDX54/DBP10